MMKHIPANDSLDPVELERRQRLRMDHSTRCDKKKIIIKKMFSFFSKPKHFYPRTPKE